MYGLRTLKISVNGNIRDFNIPKTLTHNAALENLYLQIDNNQIDLSKEMTGHLPSKLSNLTITGRAMKALSQKLLNVSPFYFKLKLISLFTINLSNV